MKILENTKFKSVSSLKLKEMERPARSGFGFGHSLGFTAACYGGKVAFSRFPPLWAKEMWHLQDYRRSLQR